MAKEVRYILLEPHEAEQAILRYLRAHGHLLAREAIAEARIVFPKAADDILQATVEWPDPVTRQARQRRLDEADLLAAVLVWCRAARVPLPRRGAKALERLGSSLALTMTLNAVRSEASVKDNRVRYADPALDGIPAPA